MKKIGGDRLKCVVYESTLSTAARSPFPNGKGYEMRIPLSPTHSLSSEGKAKRRRLRRKKGSQPRLAALGSPFQGKGLAWTLPPSYGRRCPEGAEGDGGVKKSEEDRLKCAIYESTLFTVARSPFPNREGCDTRAPLSPRHSLSRVGKAKRCDTLRP